MLSNVKKLKFNNIVNVILIPSKEEYSIIKDKLWWTNKECSKFKKESEIEIRVVLYTYFYSKSEYINKNKIELIKLALNKLYQLNEGIDLNYNCICNSH